MISFASRQALAARLARHRPALILLVAFYLLIEATSAIGLRILGYPVLWQASLPGRFQNPPRSEMHAWGAWGKPGAVGRMVRPCLDVEYRFNAVGARDKERSKDGKGRWIALGDSFMEGYGIPVADRISDVLEQRTGKPFLNFASAGDFGPLQYLLVYRELARSFEHDGLVVGFLPANDFVDNDLGHWTARYGNAHAWRYRPYIVRDSGGESYAVRYGFDGRAVKRDDFDTPPPRPDGKDRAAADADDGSLSTDILQSLSSVSPVASLIRRIRTNLRDRQSAGRPLGYFFDDPQRVDNARILMGDIAKAAGPQRKKVVLLFPMREDLLRRQRTGERYSPQIAGFIDALRAQGWGVVDTADAFAKMPLLQAMTLGCDRHWNPETTRFVGEHLARIKDLF